MAGGLRQVAALADPVGEVTAGWVRPNGLRIARVRVPLGVVAIIYENRPNVTSDAFGLCLKSGNAAFLRGSSGAITSNIAIAGVLREAVAKAGLPADAARAGRRHEPRGGGRVHAAARRHRLPDPPGRAVADPRRSSTTPPCPYVIDGDGNCHVYVDVDADLDDGRGHRRQRQDAAPVGVQRGRDRAGARGGGRRLPAPASPRRLDGGRAGGRRRRACAARRRPVAAAEEDDWANEFLDLKLAVRVVGRSTTRSTTSPATASATARRS